MGKLWIYTHDDNQHGPVPHFTGIEQLAVIPPPLIRPGLGNILDHLAVLELHDGGVPVPVAVVVGQDLQCGVVFVLGDEPAGTLPYRYILASIPTSSQTKCDRGCGKGMGTNLRNKRNKHQHQPRKHHLQPDRDPPTHRSLDLTRPPRNERSRDTASEPQHIV